MAIERHMAGKELSPEKATAMKSEIEAATQRSYVYDPDSPLLTEEQLEEFHPVNFPTMEERVRCMKEAGVIDPEKIPVLTASGK